MHGTVRLIIPISFQSQLLIISLGEIIWSSYIKLEIHLEERRREEEAERHHIEALELRENIISLASSMSKIYHHRQLEGKDPGLEKDKTKDTTSS